MHFLLTELIKFKVQPSNVFNTCFYVFGVVEINEVVTLFRVEAQRADSDVDTLKRLN